MTASFAPSDLPDTLRLLYAPTGASAARTAVLETHYPGIPLAGTPVTLVRSTKPPKPNYSSRKPQARQAGCLAEEWTRKHMSRERGPLSNHAMLQCIEQVDTDKGVKLRLDAVEFPKTRSHSDHDQRALLIRTPGLVDMGAAWILFGDQSAALLHGAHGKEGLIYPLAFRLKHPRRRDAPYTFRVSAPSVQQRGDLHLGFTVDRLKQGEYPRSELPCDIGGYITTRFSFLDARLLAGRMTSCMAQSARSATSKTDRTKTDHISREALRIWADAMTRTAEILLRHPETICLHQVARRLFLKHRIH